MVPKLYEICRHWTVNIVPIIFTAGVTAQYWAFGLVSLCAINVFVVQTPSYMKTW